MTELTEYGDLMLNNYIDEWGNRKIDGLLENGVRIFPIFNHRDLYELVSMSSLLSGLANSVYLESLKTLSSLRRVSTHEVEEILFLRERPITYLVRTFVHLISLTIRSSPFSSFLKLRDKYRSKVRVRR